MLDRLDIDTRLHVEFIDITARIEEMLSTLGATEGTILLYCPHTTAGLTINENADPNVVRDILRRLEGMVPWNHPDDRHGEGNSAAHLKACIMGFSLNIPITRGRLLLGAWQGIYLCEFDGPRRRTCYLKVRSD